MEKAEKEKVSSIYVDGVSYMLLSCLVLVFFKSPEDKRLPIMRRL